MLDAGRAARQIPGLYVGDTTAIAGFSQGGHAALWAAQLAAEWTPEQAIVGTVVGAAASEPAALASWAASQPQLSALDRRGSSPAWQPSTRRRWPVSARC